MADSSDGDHHRNVARFDGVAEPTQLAGQLVLIGS